MSRQKQGQSERKLLNGNYALIPILIVICVIPLIMRLYVYDSGLEQYAWFPDRNQEIDIFLYYRGVVLVAAAVFMAAYFAYSFYKEQQRKKTQAAGSSKAVKAENKRKGKVDVGKSAGSGQSGLEGKDPAGNASGGKRPGAGKIAAFFASTRLEQAKWLIPLAAFGVLALLSTLFSEYRDYGLEGIYEQFESIWVVLAYCIVAVYTFYFVRTREDIDTLQKGLFLVLALLGLLGITQLTGHDFWESNIGKDIYVPSQYESAKEGLSFSFSGSGNHQVYLTFYNPNYVGVFASVILPISIMLCVGNRKWQKKVAWGVLSIVLFLCALGSGSKAFLLSLIATALLGIIFYGRKMMKYVPIIIMYGLTILYVGSVYMNYVNIDVVEYMKNALTPVENVYAIEDFVINEDHVTLHYNNTPISMLCEAGASGAYFQAWDENAVEIPFTIDENNVVRFGDERFAGITVTIYTGYGQYTYIAEINAAGHRYGFAKDNEAYTYINFAYRPDEMVKADSAVFTDNDRLFTGRGYLWSRSIPLLKDNLLLGTGADTFALAFPQNDYVARINAGYQDQLITKPHSMYLQMGIQYGVLALLCFLALAVMYAVETIRLCWKADFQDKYSCLALGILMGIAGYGIMGISNDSCVALAPLVWAILGLGFAVNHLVKKELEEKGSQLEEA